MPSYDLRCPVARTLSVIGERWTVLILRDLFAAAALKFADLQASLAGISPTTLSARLRDLEDAGVVGKRFYEERPPRAEYFLTPKGRALGPVLRAMKEWGEKCHPGPRGPRR